jgi:lysyl-tRNA synthetase class 2
VCRGAAGNGVHGRARIAGLEGEDLKRVPGKNTLGRGQAGFAPFDVDHGLALCVVVRLGERRIPMLPPFERIGIVDAFVQFAQVSADEVMHWAAHDEDRFFRVLVETVEPALARIDRPLLVHRYPIQQASLARPCPDDARFAERFELWVAGVELCNGFGELTDAAEQRRRLENDIVDRRRLEKDVYPLDERFLAALEKGLPPCAGNALGLDRLVAVALGLTSLDDVLAFRFDEL